MAIISEGTWESITNQTVTGSASTSIAAICTAVDAAIRRKIYPFVPEPVTITDMILDAPTRDVLLLPVVPVRSITSILLHIGANGESSEFDSTADLLTVNDDYYMPTDDPIRNYSRSGIVYRRGAAIWGYETRRPLGMLAAARDPNRGAIKATWTAGPTSVPSDIEMAAALAVSILYDRKQKGVPLSSESWNSYSATLGSLATAESALNVPEVHALLMPYCTVHIA